jgi:hypothetical protein
LIAKLFDAAADARASILLYLRSAAVMRLAKADEAKEVSNFRPSAGRLRLIASN